MTTAQSAVLLASVFNYVVKGEAESKGAERPVIGSVAVNIPTLAAFGIEVMPKVNDAGEIEILDGVPVYESAELNYLQSAVKNAAMVKVRTLLQKNSVEVKPGKKLPETLAEYIASDSDRGAARREKAEAIKLFGEWIVSKGKAQAAVEYLCGALANADSFKTQPQEKRELVASAVVKFMEEKLESLSSFQQQYLTDTADIILTGEVVDIEDLQF